MRLPLAVIAIVLTTIAGCATQTDDGDARDNLALSERCTNPEHGFSISYPSGWYTNTGAVVPPCTAFDPAPLEIPPQSEMPFDISVVVDVEQMAIEEMTSDPMYERTISSERLVVDTRDAMRIEAEATGEGLAPPGLRSLRYMIDLGGGRSLIATTHDTDPSVYQREKEILRRMVESLDLP